MLRKSHLMQNKLETWVHFSVSVCVWVFMCVSVCASVNQIDGSND